MVSYSVNISVIRLLYIVERIVHMKKYDLIIIGAGSGGLVAAATASGMGADVLLIENKKMGGDCLNYGCVPSKVFLKSAHLMRDIKNAQKYGIDVDKTDVSLEKVMARVSEVIKEIEPHDSKERYEKLGVTVVFGEGKLETTTSVRVEEEVYNAKKIIIASGSTALVPPIDGIEKIEYYTNETIFSIDKLPQNLIVLGAGPIGLELGQGFANLGSNVSVIDKSEKLFVKDEPEVSAIMESVFEKDAMNLYLGHSILCFEKEQNMYAVKVQKDGVQKIIKGDAILFALGRRPNTKKLNLESAGVKLDARGFIEVDEKLRTSVPNIYAIGDVRGKYLFTHTASYEATVAVKNALIAPVFKTNYSNVAWATYTAPSVAHVGLSKAEAKKINAYYSEQFLNISENDRAKAEDDRVGFVKIILDKKARVIGATMVGEKAAEMITQLSLMVTHKMKISSAMSVIYQYPIQGEIVKSAALSNFKLGVKPWQTALVKKIVKL